MSQKRKHSPDTSSGSANSASIYRSEPIEDRSSTFVGYFSPTLPAKELQSLPEFKSASHKILAWRKESNQRSLTGTLQYTVGHDDDGEKSGGKKVEKVLESMRVAGACVVARWYGGVMLGPVRFTHMEDCAKAAMRKWQENEAEERSKKRKLEEEGIEKRKLVRALSERDQSIDVLRKLAGEKEKKVREGILAGVDALTSRDGNMQQDGEVAKADTQDSAQGELVPAAKPAVDYSTMPLDRLKALDKARDATLSFLLKRIDKAEADIAALKADGKADKPP